MSNWIILLILVILLYFYPNSKHSFWDKQPVARTTHNKYGSISINPLFNIDIRNNYSFNVIGVTNKTLSFINNHFSPYNKFQLDFLKNTLTLNTKIKVHNIHLYDKNKLVPFGEYIPFGKILTKFKMFGLATDGLVGFSKGESKNFISTEKFGSLLILICYEAIFPGESKNPENKASWLIHITNDAWFGGLSGPYQHLTLARMRAIEQGLPMARSANTGISAIIDPYGRIISQIGMGREGYLDGFIPPQLAPTFYSRLGTKFFNSLIIVMLVLTIFTLIINNSMNKSRKW